MVEFDKRLPNPCLQFPRMWAMLLKDRRRKWKADGRTIVTPSTVKIKIAICIF